MIKTKSIRRSIITGLFCFLFMIYLADIVYADDFSWYKNNASILSNNSIVEDIFRWLSWNVTKVVCFLGELSEGLYNKTFGLIDLTNYPAINSLIVRFKPVLVALTVLCVAIYGITLMVNKEKKTDVIGNIILAILTVTCSIYIFTTANSLIQSFKSDILTGDVKSASYELVNNNLIDLVSIEKGGGITNLNYDKGYGIIHNAGVKSKAQMDEINITETINWDDKDKGKDLYGWSDTFNEYMRYRAVKTGNTYIKAENYDGVLTSTIGNDFYYRYDFDFWSANLQLIALILMFLALAYKNVRLSYELVVAKFMAFFFSADVGGGQRLRASLMLIRDLYFTLAVSVLCVKLYFIFTQAITSFGINGVAKGIVSIFIAYTVIDGPNVVERVLGMDAGLSSSMARSMAVIGMARVGMRGARSASGELYKGARAAYTGESKVQRDHNRGNSTKAERAGFRLNKMFGGQGQKPVNRDSSKNMQDFNDNKKDERAVKSPGDNIYKDGYADNDNFDKTGQKAAQSSDGYADTEFMDKKSSSEKGKIDIGKVQRTKNPYFTETVNRLKPDAGASKAERKDFNRQVNNIVRGDHKAIKPPKGTRAKYKHDNYEKAKEMERAYKMANIKNEKGDSNE